MTEKINNLNNKILDKVLLHPELRKRPILSLSAIATTSALLIVWLAYAFPGNAFIKPFLAGIVPGNSSLIVLEAENGLIGSPMIVASDPNASGNKYVVGNVTNLTQAHTSMTAMAHPATQVLAAATPAPYSFNVMDMPSAPLPWKPSDWNVLVHSRDRPTDLELMNNAGHGPDCGAPPATHTVSTYPDAVFLCHAHIMTALKASGYGIVYMTPDHMLDFGSGTSKLTFDLSTLRTSQRDWADVWITPFGETMAAPLQNDFPDLDGPPKDAVHVMMNQFNGDTTFSVEVYNNFQKTNYNGTWWQGYDTFLTESPKTRTKFELDISTTHVKFGAPDYNFWWVDQTIPALPFSQGIVQFGDHSYNPEKDAGCGPPPYWKSLGNGCAANTWHWSDFTMSQAVPFSLINTVGNVPFVSDSTPLTLQAPAPAGAILQFVARGGSQAQVSFDKGATWQTAQMLPQYGGSLAHWANNICPTSGTNTQWCNYYTPVPAGTNSLAFKSTNWYGGAWTVQDPFVISATSGSTPPSPPPPAPTPPPPSGLSVSFTSPANNATVSGTTNVVASTSGPTPTKVEFYVDGTLTSTSASSPYQFSWDTTAVMDGMHTLDAKAYDSSGKTVTASINVNTSNGNHPLPTNTGSDMLQFTAPQAGTYYIWTRLLAPDANSDSYWLQVDSRPGILVGDGGVPFGSWTWVNHKNGSTGNRIAVNLSQGAHTLTLVGREAGAKIDTLVLSQDPSFDPNNPSIVDSIPPTVTFLSPANNATLSGSPVVQVQATDDHAVSKVDLLLDNSVVSTQTTPVGSTYSFTLDTTKFAPGSHSLLAKATDIAGNTGSSSLLNVTVSQPTPPPPPSPSPSPSPNPPPPAALGDLNNDGKVNVLDLSILIRSWGTAGGVADLNHDGTVNVLDLSILIHNWNP